MNVLYSAVVHDVKNQLAELALRLEQRGDASVELAIAIRAAQRLTKLLLLQRHEDGQLNARIDSACPAELLQDLAAEYQALFPAIRLATELTAAPPYWFFDAQLIRLALSNAVHNACRHAHAQVALRARSNDGELVIEIEDDGDGFPQEQIETATEGPKQVSAQGTGLGLFLARQIAALHTLEGKAGRIELLNRQGAVFRLRLP